MLLVLLAAAAALAPLPPGNGPQRIFTCAVGSRTLTVEQTGGEYHYRFANADRVELSLDASVARGNLFMQSGASGAQAALRFVNERHSYAIYADQRPAPSAASESHGDSGVVIFDGAREIARLRCRDAAAITLDPAAIAALPGDDAAHTAFAP